MTEEHLGDSVDEELFKERLAMLRDNTGYLQMAEYGRLERTRGEYLPNTYLVVIGYKDILTLLINRHGYGRRVSPIERFLQSILGNHNVDRRSIGRKFCFQ